MITARQRAIIAKRRPPERPRSATCPECGGRGEYEYHKDANGLDEPQQHYTSTGWHDGWWWKRCWYCNGSGANPQRP